MRRVIQLIRVSTAGQAAEDRASIPSQKAINEKTARAHGLTIVRTIQLSDVSGAQVLMAPEIQEMILLMRDPEIHGVVAREFSRLMRPEDFSDYALLQSFSETNTLLYLPEGPIDFSSKSGRLMGTIRAAIAGMERTEMLERIWAAKESKRRQGGFSQSKVCLPYAVDYNLHNGGWSYTSDASRAREAFRLMLSGDTSYYSIARKVGLNAPLVRKLLRNPIYTGWRIITERRDPSPKAKKVGINGRQADRPKIQRAPEDVIRVQVIKEPLVSESDFQQAQRIMNQKRLHFQRMREGPHRFTYNGFLLCGECRALLYTKARKFDYYVCKKKCGAPYQRRETLDPLLDKLFTKRLTSPSFLRRHILAPLGRKNPVQDDRPQLQAQLTALEGKRKRVLDSYFDGVIDQTERETRLSAIITETRAIQGMISRSQPVQKLTLETLTAAFAPFVEFDWLNREGKRTLLNTLTPEIVVSKYVVKGMFVGLQETHTAADAHQNGTYSRHYLKLAA